MRGETGERWRVLCEQAAVAQDHDRLLMLIRNINGLLDEKEARLAAARSKRDETKPLKKK
jgi:hypothetical protein